MSDGIKRTADIDLANDKYILNVKDHIQKKKSCIVSYTEALNHIIQCSRKGDNPLEKS